MPADAAVPLRVVIADDEPVARDTLRTMLASHDGVEIVGEAATGREAVSAIDEQAPDLVLLDIRMPEMDGFEVLDALGSAPSPAVVFVTAYDEFAVRAFEVHALDYVLKPFGDRRLREAIDRAGEQIRLGRAASLAAGLDVLHRRSGRERTEATAADGPGGGARRVGAPGPDAGRRGGSLAGRGASDERIERITVRRGRRRRVVPVGDIDWIEGAGDYARLHVGEEQFLVRRTLKTLARSLELRRFVRIHRSVVVNLSRVKEHHPISHGDHAVILHDGTRLRASRTRREAFLRRLRGDRP